MTRKRGLSGVSNITLGQSKANKRASKKMYFQENMEKMDYYQGKSITKSQFCSPKSVYERLYYQKNKHKINSQRRVLYKKKQAQSRFLECPVVRKSQRQSTLPKFQGKVAVNTFNEKIVMNNDVGNMEYVCVKCGALMFKDEGHKYISKESNQLCFSLCCSYGNIRAPPVSEPPLLF